MVFDRDPRGYRADAAPERHRTTHHYGGGDELDFKQLLASSSAAQGSILVAQAAGAGRFTYQEYPVAIPAANVRNVFGTDNGDTKGSYKTALDATLPVIVTPGGAGAAGTSLVFSHRDHDHPATDVASAASLAAVVALEYTTSVGTHQQLTSNSTAFQNVTNMALPLGTNQKWRFAMTIFYISSVAADIKIQFTVPAGMSLLFASVGVVAGTTVPISSIPAAIALIYDGTATLQALEISGTVLSAGTAGNLQLQAAQNTATVEITDFIEVGSNLFGRRV